MAEGVVGVLFSGSEKLGEPDRGRIVCFAFSPSGRDSALGTVSVVENGINRTEKVILKAVQVGTSKPDKIFAAAQACEESRFMGDSLFWLYLMRMTKSQPQLLRVSNGERFRLPSSCSSPVEFREQNILVTPAGKKVLAGELDWIEINGIEKWLGGVHLKKENLWRWDSEPQSLIRTSA